MQIEKPKPKRVYLTASDPTGEMRSKTITVYDTTPEEIVDKVKEALTRPERRRRDRQPA